MSVVLIPGSFDPITLGHRKLIEQACASFDRVVVGVLQNDDKKYMFSPEERLDFVKICVFDLSGVEAVRYDGMTADLCREVGADTMIRGVRNATDYAWEEKIVAYHAEHNPDLKTFLWICPPGYAGCSSSAVREAITAGRVPEELVTPSVAARLHQILGF